MHDNNGYFDNQTLLDTLSEFPLLSLVSPRNREVVNRITEHALEGRFEEIFRQATPLYADNYYKAITGVLHGAKPGDALYGYGAQFRHNAANLAAWKAHRMAGELTELKDEAEIRQTIKRYNQWQAVEYNAITARARTSRQLIDFRTRGHIYPNIEWLRTRAADPREQHLALVGLTLPINHSFWNTNQPGNLYGCKCDWKQTDAPPHEITPPSVPPSPGLEGNPLNTGELITRKAGHFTSQKNEVVNRAIIERLGDEQWVNLKANNGMDIKVHLLHGTGELRDNMAVLNDFLKIEKQVAGCRFLPKIHKDDKKLKERFYPPEQLPKNDKKNADAVIVFANKERWVVDFKITGSPSLQRVLTGSAQQAKYAVIKLLPGINIGYDRIKADVDLKIRNGQLFGVFVLNHEGMVIYSRLNTTAGK